MQLPRNLLWRSGAIVGIIVAFLSIAVAAWSFATSGLQDCLPLSSADSTRAQVFVVNEDEVSLFAELSSRPDAQASWASLDNYFSTTQPQRGWAAFIDFVTARQDPDRPYRQNPVILSSKNPIITGLTNAISPKGAVNANKKYPIQITHSKK